ncbi:FMN-dependent NADH-azoreductase [Streptomyces subrutilus]|uniref:FMN dependent NADH:quinone oxidoreductase n=1 Tax=Streptomyces subrutilus TaxID=36818 RepID=A0A1E5PX83_9ACTN|nr:NAD(P)H-dependent oxidoreductase [Streptomyces subrutilus]OEJ34103.1 NAD(P)H dehydrogenase [Streptomyces subrutilus]
MSHLLHVDSSFGTQSVSRELTGYFAAEWRKNHPGTGYVHRDLAAEPVPHISHAVHQSLLYPDAEHGQSAEERDLTAAITREVLEASVIVLGVPMHNYAVPTTLKAWLDRIVHPGHMVMPGNTGPLSGKTVVAVLARGGSYAPGTPREHHDFQQPYLKAILQSVGLGEDLTFVTAEFTMAAVAPQMAHLKPMGEASLKTAYDTLAKLAQ